MQRLLFSWATPLLRKGADAGELNAEDLLNVDDAAPGARPGVCATALWEHWTHVRGRGAGLLR
jgi:hypothetical protein